MAKVEKQVIKRVIKTVMPYKISALFSLALTVLSVGLTLYIPVLAGWAIDSIKGFENVDFNSLYKYLFMISICAVLSGLLQWIISVINNNIAYKTVRSLRNQAFAHLNKLPLSYIDSHPYGDILSRITADAEQFTDGLILGFSQFFNGIVTILITLVFMVMINPLISLVVVALTPISLFIAKFIASRTHGFFKAQSDIRGEQTAYINEKIQNAKTVKAFSYETKSVKDFENINDKLRKVSVKAIFFSSLTNPSTRFVNNLIYAAVGLAGALAVISNPEYLSVGGFVSFLAYANQYTKPFNEISGVLTELQNALVCAGRIFELLDTEPVSSDEDLKELKNANGNVEINNVSFSYDKTKKLLQNLNLQVKSGQKIAIVGPTGCGKTTLINLLMRFYDVDSGSIKVEDFDIRDITRKSLRESYGMVLQETWLKDGTVRDNIAYGNENATDEEIIAAAKSAHAHKFIKRLPNGYDTHISNSSGKLSVGERQLLCIARAMLSNPSMLILDEATSSIDTHTEQKVQSAFRRLMQNKTSFVVAHRLSTILDADLILVMKDGNIIEQGTHKELLEKGGFYTNLYNSQFAV
ncbi:MAG: ABC transporter ATP-binding protein [Clostridia bacterium]|nr:ABC transporter ATP-binding protein [Clostridia bacterium]